MEKAQVKIEIEGGGLHGPLGKDIVHVFIASEVDAHYLVVLASSPNGMIEVKRTSVPLGALEHQTADIWSEMVANFTYLALARTLGIQGTLEMSP